MGIGFLLIIPGRSHSPRSRRPRKVNIKVKLSLCFNCAPRHGGVLGELRYSSTHSLTSAIYGGKWSASRPGRCTHWIGGWVGPRAFLEVIVKRKIPSPCRESNPRTPIVQPVDQRYTEYFSEMFQEIFLKSPWI
jgi:hypothetical protein